MNINMGTIRLMKERVDNRIIFNPKRFHSQLRNISYQKLPIPSKTIINQPSHRNISRSIDEPITIDASNSKRNFYQQQYFNLGKKKVYKRISLLNCNYHQKKNSDMRGNRNCIKSFMNFSNTHCINDSSIRKGFNNCSSSMRDYYKQRKRKEIKNMTKISNRSALDITLNNTKWKVKKFSCLSKAGETYKRQFKINQDSHLALMNCCKFRIKNTVSVIQNENAINLFGVLDGHGDNGHLISRMIKRFFEEYFAQEEVYAERTDNETLSALLCKNNFKLIKKAFETTSDYLKIKKIDAALSGTTCVLVFIVNNIIICANVGDSRAVLYSSSGKITELSKDHKPHLKDEFERIIKCGGRVSRVERNDQGPFRVWVKNSSYPGLAMSRSIGDFIAESVGVISIPDVNEKTVNELDCNYIVIGSDGLWEWMTNEEIGNIVRPFYKNYNSIGAVQQLMEIARSKWIKLSHTIDDITVIVIFFGITN